MTMPIVKLLKGLFLAAVVLAVPTFAVFGLMANGSTRSPSVDVPAELDVFRNGFGSVSSKQAVRSNAAAPSISSDDTFVIRNWVPTVVKPCMSPTCVCNGVPTGLPGCP